MHDQPVHSNRSPDALLRQERAEVAAWARELLTLGDRAVVMDVERTPPHGQIASVAVLGLDHRLRYASLVGGAATGRSDATPPAFSRVVWALQPLLDGRVVIGWTSSCHHHPLRAGVRAAFGSAGTSMLGWLATIRFECVAPRYAIWHDTWTSWWHTYRHERLPGGDHTAVGDCRAVLAILQQLARGDPDRLPRSSPAGTVA